MGLDMENMKAQLDAMADFLKDNRDEGDGSTVASGREHSG